MKIVVLGAGGMLGHRMYLHLRSRFGHESVIGTVRDSHSPEIFFYDAGVVGFDPTSFVGLTWLKELRPDVIVNCIGIIKQRPQKPVESIEVNALLPHRLAELVNGWGGRLIHFSTDCVFSGAKGDYREDSPTDARDLYGKTKAMGEVAWSSRAVTLRTSIIGRELGGSRLSLLEWFLSQQSCKGYTTHFFSGVTTHHLAKVTGDIIEKHESLSGLFNLAGPSISKHDLLCEIRKAAKVEIGIYPERPDYCDRTLDGSRLAAILGPTPSWPDMLEEVFRA